MVTVEAFDMCITELFRSLLLFWGHGEISESLMDLVGIVAGGIGNPNQGHRSPCLGFLHSFRSPQAP